MKISKQNGSFMRYLKQKGPLIIAVLSRIYCRDDRT
jgi:hypothetical protein